MAKKQVHWLDEVLMEAREILVNFCKENDIPKGRELADRVLHFARDPQGIHEPISEFDLFVCVDALGDHVEGRDDEIEILFQFIRWNWWSVKFGSAAPGETFKRPREIEADAFHRQTPPITDALEPSDN